MTRQMELLVGRGLHDENIFRQGSRIETALKRLFLKYQKPTETLEIVNIHGSIAFNTCLIASIPESAGFTNIQCGLRDFRSKPHFDMLFYSHPHNTENGAAGFLEDLCYCRMLLRPGASLFLAIKEIRSRNIAGWFTEKRSREVSWLHQAGFVNITTQKMDNGFGLVGGQRPSHTF